ncbi:MAG: hypothetical protein JW829_17555 [Pirellulales bacterium]|nr:hypothetical protein [Pirellulales bacterium]
MANEEEVLISNPTLKKTLLSIGGKRIVTTTQDMDDTIEKSGSLLNRKVKYIDCEFPSVKMMEVHLKNTDNLSVGLGYVLVNDDWLLHRVLVSKYRIYDFVQQGSAYYMVVLDKINSLRSLISLHDTLCEIVQEPEEFE